MRDSGLVSIQKARYMLAHHCTVVSAEGAEVHKRRVKVLEELFTRGHSIPDAAAMSGTRSDYKNVD
jgi:hypothetical protein